MATDAEQGKTTAARLKGHITRSLKQLQKAIDSKDLRTSQLGYNVTMDKISKLNEFLEELETIEGIDAAWFQRELNLVDKQKEDLCEKFADILQMKTLANQQQTEVENDLQEAGMIVSNKRIPKNNVKKPPDLEDTASLKEYEEWHAKVMDYFVLTGINECE